MFFLFLCFSYPVFQREPDEKVIRAVQRFLVSVRLSGPIPIIDFWYRLLKWADTKNMFDY
jgi:hypothetical protein